MSADEKGLPVSGPGPAPESRGGREGSAAQPSRTADRALVVFAFALAVVSFLGLLSAGGIWDPHELRVAEFARRIAVALLGGAELAIAGADNTVPTLGDLERGQLPFTSIALGFRLFGLHEWAGRLPLGLWALIGASATYLLVRLLGSRRAAAFAVIVLATCPLYFLHARTMLGEIVTMAAMIVAVAGFSLAGFDTNARGLGWRMGAVTLGTFGLVAGFASRGLLVGVAVPAITVGLTWVICRSGGLFDAHRPATLVGASCLLLGTTAIIWGLLALNRVMRDAVQPSLLVTGAVIQANKLPTFDFVLQQLGHGMFPWSAVLPVALGRVLLGRAELDPPAVALRTLAVTGPTLAFACYALLAPISGTLPFGMVGLLAVLVAVALDDLEHAAERSRAVAMTVVALGILLYLDFKNAPDKGLVPFAVEGAAFPESFQEPGLRLLQLGTLACVLVFFAAAFDRPDPDAQPFDRAPYRRYVETVRTVHAGNVAFALVAAEVCLILLFLLKVASDSFFHFRYFETVAPPFGLLIKTGWWLLPLLVALPLGALAARDLSRALFSPGLGLPALARVWAAADRARAAVQHRAPRLLTVKPSRSVTACLGVALCGGILSFAYYPALAAQISPRQVFESYGAFRRPGERLGMIGVGSGSASYYAGTDVPAFGGATEAFNWLMAPPERRWLVIRAADLPTMNSLYRKRTNGRDNLPVLDARSSEILLVSNRLLPGEHNGNPLSALVSSAAPKPMRRLDATLGGQLKVVGWDVLDERGASVPTVTPGRSYRFAIYYRVLAPISGGWETFIHIDGYQRRFNGDHPTLQGKYPFHLWNVGDYITDVHEFALEPNFTAGTYSVFFGLFVGSSRLEVVEGEHHENRLRAGTLQVR